MPDDEEEELKYKIETSAFKDSFKKYFIEKFLEKFDCLLVHLMQCICAFYNSVNFGIKQILHVWSIYVSYLNKAMRRSVRVAGKLQSSPDRNPWCLDDCFKKSKKMHPLFFFFFGFNLPIFTSFVVNRALFLSYSNILNASQDSYER